MLVKTEQIYNEIRGNNAKKKKKKKLVVDNRSTARMCGTQSTGRNGLITKGRLSINTGFFTKHQ